LSQGVAKRVAVRAFLDIAGTRERAGTRRGKSMSARGPAAAICSRIARGGIGFAPETIATAVCRRFIRRPANEAAMTAYLISLALAGLIAIAVWEAFS
jgi:hypothetical protein